MPSEPRPERPQLMPDELKAFKAAGVVRHFVEGERLVSLGSASSEVFYLLSGVVKIAVVSTTGTESVFGLRTAGDFIGEMSSLNAARRSADVVALEPTTAVVVSATRFGDFVESHPKVAISLLRTQTRRLNEMTIRAMLGTRSVRARVAQRLIDLSGGEGTVHLTHGDLAQYIDASREWTSKALGELRRQGAIRTERGRVIVLDEQMLLDISLED